jgi:hypothetical protein
MKGGMHRQVEWVWMAYGKWQMANGKKKKFFAAG